MSMLSRRAFVSGAAAFGAGALLPWARAAHALSQQTRAGKLEARAYFIMHTVVEVVAIGERGSDLVRACEAAAGACRAVELRMNFHDPRSELSRLNEAAGRGEWVEVSDELLVVLEEARRIHIASSGAFDPGTGALVRLYRKTRESGAWPGADEIARARESAGMDSVEIRGRRVRFGNSGMQLDLSGIAKGYAVDRAVAAMRGAGARAGVVNAGGDLFAFGGVADALPRAAIQDPQDAGRVRHELELLEEGLASSGDAEQGVVVAGRFCSHLIDPATGAPARPSLGSASVRAASAMSADAWASALYVRPALAARAPVESLLIGPRGEEVSSARFFSNSPRKG
ncbi:MAG: FAD:protein FMN transferase [Chrysiogenetes bacterium]|nr:FAD:protein FMN transferase [Chrysiogenetes bacterium]